MPEDFTNTTKRCDVCGNALKLNNTRDIRRKRFCSKACLGSWIVSQGLLTNDYSTETREKMRQSKLDLLKTGWKPLGWSKYGKTALSTGKYLFIGHDRAQRVVMERYLGRQLTSDEVVHHIDGNKENNQIGNLQILSKAEHAGMHCQRRIELWHRKNSMPAWTKADVCAP